MNIILIWVLLGLIPSVIYDIRWRTFLKNYDLKEPLVDSVFRILMSVTLGPVGGVTCIYWFVRMKLYKKFEQPEECVIEYIRKYLL